MPKASSSSGVEVKMPKATPNTKTPKATRKKRTACRAHLKRVFQQYSIRHQFYTLKKDGSRKQTSLVLREQVADDISERLEFLIDTLVPLAIHFMNLDKTNELLPKHVAYAAAQIGYPALALDGGVVENVKKRTPKPRRPKKMDKKAVEKKKITEQITTVTKKTDDGGNSSSSGSSDSDSDSSGDAI